MTWSNDIEEGIEAIRKLDGNPKDIPREAIESTIEAANRTLSLYFGKDKEEVGFMDLWLHTQDDITRLQEALNRALMREEIALRHSWKTSSIERHTKNITDIRDLQNKITTFEGKLRNVSLELRQNKKIDEMDDRLSGFLRTTTTAVGQLQFDVRELQYWNALQRAADPKLQQVEEFDAGKTGLKLAGDNTVVLASQLLAYYTQLQIALKSLESEAPRIIEGIEEFGELKGSLSSEIADINKWLKEIQGTEYAELNVDELDAKVSALTQIYADIQAQNQMVKSGITSRMLPSPTGTFLIDYQNYSVPAKALAGMSTKVQLTNADIADVVRKSEQRRTGIAQLIEQGNAKAKPAEADKKTKSATRKGPYTPGYSKDGDGKLPMEENRQQPLAQRKGKKGRGRGA